MKKCPKCKEEKSLSEFHIHRRNKDGHQKICKVCRSEWQSLTREKISEHYHKANYNEKYAERKEVWRQTLKGKYSSYRAKAKSRKIQFQLTYEEFLTFWQQSCHYCGIGIETIGLDRIDSSQGYVLQNIVSCCSICNQIKSDTNITLLRTHIEKMLSRSW